MIGRRRPGTGSGGLPCEPTFATAHASSSAGRSMETGGLFASVSAIPGWYRRRRRPKPRTPGYLLHMVHAFVLIDAEPARVADLATELAELDGVAEVYSVAGQADIVAVVRVRRHEQLADVVTRGISRRPGVIDTRTLIAFQSFSRHDLEAMWDLGSGD